MKRTVQTTLIALVAMLCLAAAPASAIDFGLFGSYMDSKDIDDAWGFGGRVAFFDRIQLQMTATWYASFNHTFKGIDFGDDFSNKIDIIPVDIGGAWYFGPEATGVYVGGGGTYFALQTDVGNIKDEFGYYVMLGYQLKGFYLEALYRDAEGTVKDIREGDFNYETKVDLTGWGINAGWRF